MAVRSLRRSPPLPGAVQAALVALLVAIAAASWALTDDRMGGMDTAPGADLGALGWFLVTWVVMMAAMMLPSVAPMVVARARIQRERGDTTVAATALFVAGYVLAWTVVGLAGYAIVEGARSLDLGFLAWDDGGPYVAGGIIVVAALYQLTPAKDACLRHCRESRMLAADWHGGALGALRMGVEHGGFCIGCCWALMAALFALGIMSVGWMAFVAAIIAAEKLLPWRGATRHGIAILLAVLGLAVAFASDDVPGLTTPGESGMDSTMMMEG